MKLTVKFTNDNNPEVTDDLDLEIDTEVYEQMEKVAKEKGVSVEEIFYQILQMAVAENDPGKE